MAKEPDSKQERCPLFTADEVAVAHLFTLFTFDDSSKMNQSWLLPFCFILRRGWSVLMN